MRIFSVTHDVTLETNKFRRKYLAVSNPEAAQVDRLYLEVGEEVKLILDNLKAKYAEDHTELALDEEAIKKLDPTTVGLEFATEASLLPWPFFPARLGRISSRFAGDGVYFHQESQVLPAQLQALRASKPEKQHFRFAVINGFGSNLGDCTIGVAAFRHVLHCLKQHLPSVSCDVIFGPGTSPATADIVGYEKDIEQVLFQSPTVCDFAQYDGYFDFSGLILMPRYNELPTVDWYLWWCGIDPQTIPAEQKRNHGHIRWDAWNSVQALLRDKPGKKIFFNPKASVPLRTMHAEVASKFAKRLLELDPEMKLVVDQPIELKHKRLIDLSAQIDSPEKFKALVGQMDGVITVNSFASHLADMCAVPAVHLCSCLPGSFYPYYPYSATAHPKGYEQLPAFGKVKVSEDEWKEMSSAYQAAWETLTAGEVLKQLQEKTAQRMAARNEPKGLRLSGGRKPVVCIETGQKPLLRRFKLAPEHARTSERFAHLTQNVLVPGSVCVLACAPESGLPLTLAQRVAPHGQLIVLEPRALLARSLESSFFNAGAFATQIHQTMALAGAEQARINVLDPWSESSSTQWGNTHQAVTVPNRTIDDMALDFCHCILIQSPMHFGEVIAGAVETLKRCRPYVFMAPISREESGNACKTAMNADYVFWAEPAMPGQDLSTMLLVGVPKEKQVKIDGFFKVEME